MSMSKIKIADFAEVITGGTPSTSNPEYWENGDVPWLQSGACQNDVITGCDTFITQKGLENSAAKMMKPDSVLIALTGATTGKVGYLTFEACANQSVTGIQPNERFVSKYLYYYLRGIRQKILDDSYGGAQKHISQGYVKNIEVPLGSIEEQKTITKLLESVDTTIALRQQELQLLDDLIKVRFVEMFGDPNVNSMNWEMGTIDDIGRCVAGATPSTAKPEYWENGTIPWLSSGEVNKGRIYETDTKITQLGYDNASTKMVPAKTVVLAMAGQGRTRGMAAITEIELCTNQSICSIVNNERVNHEYLLSFLKMQYKELRKASTSAEGRGGLNLKIIGAYPIMIPPIQLQNQFAAFTAQIDKSKVV